MTRLAIAVAGACALALVQAPAALAVIQIDRGISGVRISNTRAQVRAALGTPAKQKTGSNTFGRFVQYTYKEGITVTFQGEDRVSSIDTNGLGDRTVKGVGVGTAEADVKSGVSGVKCETIAGARSCHTGKFSTGKRITDFHIVDGVVARVTVGVVLD